MYVNDRNVCKYSTTNRNVIYGYFLLKLNCVGFSIVIFVWTFLLYFLGGLFCCSFLYRLFYYNFCVGFSIVIFVWTFLLYFLGGLFYCSFLYGLFYYNVCVDFSNIIFVCIFLLYFFVCTFLF